MNSDMSSDGLFKISRVISSLALAVCLVFLGACSRPHEHDSEAAASKKAVTYYCPMHPAYTSDRPGTCPICNMNLVPLKEEAAPPAALTREAHEHLVHENEIKDPKTLCLMHECPMMKQGKTCPMLLVASEGEKPECPFCKSHLEAMTAAPADLSDVTGYAAVVMTPEKRALLGIETQPALKRPIEKTLRLSGQVMPESSLSKKVWVYAKIYEPDYSAARHSQNVIIRVPITGETLPGRIESWTTQFDPITRSPMLRALVPNPQRALRADMFVDVEIPLPLGDALVVPQEAVFQNGVQNIVFVELSPGVFEPRSVEPGERVGSEVQIKSGLAEGEAVVTRGNFLIDSESRLKSALKGAGAAAGGHQHGS